MLPRALGILVLTFAMALSFVFGILFLAKAIHHAVQYSAPTSSWMGDAIIGSVLFAVFIAGLIFALIVVIDKFVSDD